jgi:hypothetical protein
MLRCRERPEMTRTLTIIAIAAAAALAGCNKENHNLVAGEIPDPMASELANAAPVELPPSIQASKSYRCKDNSLIYIDWLSDGSARVKASRNEVGTSVPAGADSPLKGDAHSASVSYNGKSCKG